MYIHDHYDWYSTATNTYTTRRGERWWISRKDYTWDEVIRRSWTSESWLSWDRFYNRDMDGLKKENMMKEQKLVEIQKWKESALGEVHELEQQLAARGKIFSFILYLLIYFLTFRDVLIYSYVIFIYIYFLILCHLFFLCFRQKKMRTCSNTGSDCAQSSVSIRIVVLCFHILFIFLCHFISIRYFLYCVTKCFIVHMEVTYDMSNLCFMILILEYLNWWKFFISYCICDFSNCMT